MSRLTDVHSHFVTAEYVAAAKQFGHETPDRMPAWPQWSVVDHLKVMNENGIRRSVLSISSPGVHFGDDEAALELARTVNDFGIRIASEHPHRFGLFASLPLPDVDRSIAEVRRVSGVTGVTGFAVLSNAAGVYLGDWRYRPLWADLNSRGATVFVHPTKPPNSDAVALGRPLPMIEFLFDAARTVVDLMFADVFLEYPNITFIVTHSGGVLPMLMERVEIFRGSSAGFGSGKAEDSAREQLSGLWFDCAGTPMPTALNTLASIVGTDRLVFGSDYCFTPPGPVAAGIRAIDNAGVSPTGQRWLDLFESNTATLRL